MKTPNATNVGAFVRNLSTFDGDQRVTPKTSNHNPETRLLRDCPIIAVHVFGLTLEARHA